MHAAADLLNPRCKKVYGCRSCEEQLLLDETSVHSHRTLTPAISLIFLFPSTSLVFMADDCHNFYLHICMCFFSGDVHSEDKQRGNEDLIGRAPFIHKQVFIEAARF